MIYADGDKYDGEWIDGQMHGVGVYFYADGDKYEGNWKYNKRHGHGVVTYAADNGRIAEKYDGEWFESKMHGTGKYFYMDGGYYEGFFLFIFYFGKAPKILTHFFQKSTIR